MLIKETKLRQIVRNVLKEESFKKQFKVGDVVEVLDVPDDLLGQHKHAHDWPGCIGVIDSNYLENDEVYCKVHSLEDDLEILRPLKIYCNSVYLELAKKNLGLVD